MPDSQVSVATLPILIVEDNEATANALAKILNSAKLQTVLCFRGSDGIEYAQKNLIAAALIDLHLPDVSGLVVSQKIRQHMGPRTPIVILSGDTSMEMLNALPHVGATYFFSKPVNAAQLVERLQEWISAGDGAR